LAVKDLTEEQKLWAQEIDLNLLNSNIQGHVVLFQVCVDDDL